MALLCFFGGSAAPLRAQTFILPWTTSAGVPLVSNITYLQPITIGTNGNAIATGDRLKYTNDATGTATFYNLVLGTYVASVLGTYQVTPVQFTVTNTVGTYYVLFLSTVATNSSPVQAWSMAASDARYLAASYATNFIGTPAGLATNLVPAGAVYDANGNYALAGITNGARYFIHIGNFGDYTNTRDTAVYYSNGVPFGSISAVGLGADGVVMAGSNTLYLTSRTGSGSNIYTRIYSISAAISNTLAGNFNGTFNGSISTNSLQGTLSNMSPVIDGFQNNGVAVYKPGNAIYTSSATYSSTNGNSYFGLITGTEPGLCRGYSLIFNGTDQYFVTYVSGNKVWVYPAAGATYTGVSPVVNPIPSAYYDTTGSFTGAGGGMVDSAGSVWVPLLGQSGGLWLYDQRGANINGTGTNGWLLGSEAYDGQEALTLHSWYPGSADQVQIVAGAPPESFVVGQGYISIHGPLINEQNGNLKLGGGVSQTSTVEVQSNLLVDAGLTVSGALTAALPFSSVTGTIAAAQVTNNSFAATLAPAFSGANLTGLSGNNFNSQGANTIFGNGTGSSAAPGGSTNGSYIAQMITVGTISANTLSGNSATLTTTNTGAAATAPLNLLVPSNAAGAVAVMNIGTAGTNNLATLNMFPGHSTAPELSIETPFFAFINTAGEGLAGGGRLQLGGGAYGNYPIKFVTSSATALSPVSENGNGLVYQYNYWNGSGNVSGTVNQTISTENLQTGFPVLTTWDGWTTSAQDNSDPEQYGVTRRQDIIGGLGVKNYGAHILDATSTTVAPGGTLQLNIGQAYQDAYLLGATVITITNASALTNTASGTLSVFDSSVTLYSALSNQISFSNTSPMTIIWEGLTNGIAAPTFVQTNTEMDLRIKLTVSAGVTNCKIFPTYGAYTVNYDSNALQYFTAENGSGSSLSALESNAVNTLIVSLKQASLWSTLDALYPLRGGTSNSMSWNAAATNKYRLAFVGTASSNFVASGFITEGGGSWYADTGFNPSSATSPNFTQNSASLGIYVGAANPTPAYVSGAAMGGAVGANNYKFIILEGSSSFWGVKGLNSTTGGATVALATPYSGFTVYSVFNNGTEQYGYYGAQGQYNGSVTTAGVPNNDLFIGAQDDQGSADAYATARFALVMYGSGWTAAQYLSASNIVQTFVNSVGAQ